MNVEKGLPNRFEEHIIEIVKISRWFDLFQTLEYVICRCTGVLEC